MLEKLFELLTTLLRASSFDSKETKSLAFLSLKLIEEFILLQSTCEVHHVELSLFNFVNSFYISFDFFSFSIEVIASAANKFNNSETKMKISEIEEYVAELIPLALRSSLELRKQFGILALESFLSNFSVGKAS